MPRSYPGEANSFLTERSSVSAVSPPARDPGVAADPAPPAPLTPVPLTPVPLTPVPLTPVPSTPVPLTPVPLTPVPLTPVPLTPVPLTLAGRCGRPPRHLADLDL